MGSISQSPDPDTYDVVVVGGGAAGIGAAIGARNANSSARILLVETESCLGGAATHRGVVSYCGLFTLGENPRKAVGGVWDDISLRLQKIKGLAEKPDRHRGIFHVRPFLQSCILVAYALTLFDTPGRGTRGLETGPR